MPADLREVKNFRQLLAYLRNELDWPIEQDADVDDLTFDYTPEELGLSDEYHDVIKEVRQIRPLTSNQPWGIFYVNFEKQKLPVVVLRRILRALVVKQRRSANPGTRRTWQLHDLLFISSYGEEKDRHLTFAHFYEDPKYHDLPTLHVLGWDSDDTKLTLQRTEETLRNRLRWPTDDTDATAWRTQWSGAFSLTIGYSIRTAAELAGALAELAKRIRDRAKIVLAAESEKGRLRRLHKAFQSALIADLNREEFASMYAQTIAYGLLVARISRPAGVTARSAADLVPVTNPFLKEMLVEFLDAGGRRDAFDFDELGVNEVVALLNSERVDMDAILRDFGHARRNEDPVIHFYETFLAAYDKDEKVKRGVFYTPQPVVSYIVRSVHALLQTEYRLPHGLAATETWGEMLRIQPSLQLPPLTDEHDETRTIAPSEFFVQILDPATGTATFLVEVMDVIHRHLAAVWEKNGLPAMPQIHDKPKGMPAPRTFADYWNLYVRTSLLPRLHGFELMMAPYAIAHMKLGLKLKETGFTAWQELGDADRARVYLTNALEPKVKQRPQIGFDALAHEAAAVNEIKWYKRFTVVIGNPPYSRVSQNQSDFIQRLVKDYKEPVADEANQQPLDDDYIKCLRLAQHFQSTAKCGIIGFITNHTVISGILFRGVRQRLLEDQNFVAIVDLHGNSNIKEKCPDGSRDDNVFDIQAGVAVTIAAKAHWRGQLQCVFNEVWGLRDAKYAALVRLCIDQVKHPLSPAAPYFFLKPIDLSAGEELKGAFALPDIFPSYSSGLMTVRDNLAIAFDREELRTRIEIFRSTTTSDEQFQAICPVKDYRKWTLSSARGKVRADRHWEDRMEIVNYRPFDKRWIFYSPDIITYPNFRVMNQFKRKNLGLICSRIHKGEEHAHEFATREMVEIIFLSSKSSNNAFLFPLYIFEPDGDLPLEEGGALNLSGAFLKQLCSCLSLPLQPNSSLPAGLTPEDIFNYAYAILHSPSYRSRYAELLKIEFPRLPLPRRVDLFRASAHLGGELVALHLLESPKLDHLATEYLGGRAPEVEKISWSDDTVWIDKAQTTGFKGVRAEVWNFHIGGYQVCEKWLKDRKGRKLSADDRTHYQKIIVAVSETIRLMAEIDTVIEKHGGFPAAFASVQVASPNAPTATSEAKPKAQQTDLAIQTEDELPLG